MKDSMIIESDKGLKMNVYFEFIPKQRNGDWREPCDPAEAHVEKIEFEGKDITNRVTHELIEDYILDTYK